MKSQFLVAANPHVWKVLVQVSLSFSPTVKVLPYTDGDVLYLASASRTELLRAALGAVTTHGLYLEELIYAWAVKDEAAPLVDQILLQLYTEAQTRAIRPGELLDAGIAIMAQYGAVLEGERCMPAAGAVAQASTYSSYERMPSL